MKIFIALSFFFSSLSLFAGGGDSATYTKKFVCTSSQKPEYAIEIYRNEDVFAGSKACFKTLSAPCMKLDQVKKGLLPNQKDYDFKTQLESAVNGFASLLSLVIDKDEPNKPAFAVLVVMEKNQKMKDYVFSCEGSFE